MRSELLTLNNTIEDYGFDDFVGLNISNADWNILS